VHPFATERARTRLQAAADAVERESSIELVIAVRQQSTELLHADLIGGAVAAFAMLSFTLFAPPEFSLLVIALSTVAMFVAGTMGTRALPGVRRLIASTTGLREGVLRGARACFVELGVHGTRGRTGVLVYVSLAEARVAVVADIGVHAAMSQAFELLARHVEAVADENGLDEIAIETLAAAIEGFGAGARHNLPRAPDDVDELGEWQ
jgi:putative membrane protein